MGWISVDERLPESNGKYLVISNGSVGPICIWEYLANYNEWAVFGSRHITHWRPLPPNPNEQQPQNLSHGLIECLGVAADKAGDDGEYDIEQWLRKFGTFDAGRLGVIPELVWEGVVTQCGGYEINYRRNEGILWVYPSGNVGALRIECDSIEHGKQLANEHHFARMSEQLEMLRRVGVTEQIGE